MILWCNVIQKMTQSVTLDLNVLDNRSIAKRLDLWVWMNEWMNDNYRRMRKWQIQLLLSVPAVIWQMVQLLFSHVSAVRPISISCTSCCRSCLRFLTLFTSGIHYTPGEYSRILSPVQLKNRFGFVFSPLLHVHFKPFLAFCLFVCLIDWLIVCLFFFAVNEVWFCAFLGLWLCLMIAGNSLVSWCLRFSFPLFRVSSCCRCWCFSLAITLCCWFVCFSSATLPVSSFLRLVWVLDLGNSWWFHFRAGMSLVF